MDCTILIFTCAMFSDLWDNQIQLLNKFWPEHPPYYLVSDTLGLYGRGQENRTLCLSKSQSTRLIMALEHCSTEYVFLTLDDYFLKGQVNHERLENIIQTMHAEGIDYCRLYPKFTTKTPTLQVDNELKRISFQRGVYEVNFYPGVWKRESLLAVLAPEETIWEAEVFLSRRFKDKNFIGVAERKMTVYPFVDVVRKGKYLRPAYRFMKKNDLFISDRPLRSRSEDFVLWIQGAVKSCTPRRLRPLAKKLGRKLGMKFYSDKLLEDESK